LAQHLHGQSALLFGVGQFADQPGHHPQVGAGDRLRFRRRAGQGQRLFSRLKGGPVLVVQPVDKSQVVQQPGPLRRAFRQFQSLIQGCGRLAGPAQLTIEAAQQFAAFQSRAQGVGLLKSGYGGGQ